MASYCQGQQDALRQLMSRYERELYLFLLRFTNDPASAEDVFQETFIQLHRIRGRFDASRRFKPWIYTIAANKARDQLRARKRKAEITLEAAETDEGGSLLDYLTDPVAEPVEIAGKKERTEAVQRIVENMPEHLKTVLLLGYFQGMAYKDIAKALDVPLGTVKSRLHTAVNYFAKRWQKQAGKHA